MSFLFQHFQAHDVLVFADEVPGIFGGRVY